MSASRWNRITLANWVLCFAAGVAVGGEPYQEPSEPQTTEIAPRTARTSGNRAMTDLAPPAPVGEATVTSSEPRRVPIFESTTSSSVPPRTERPATRPQPQSDSFRAKGERPKEQFDPAMMRIPNEIPGETASGSHVEQAAPSNRASSTRESLPMFAQDPLRPAQNQGRNGFADQSVKPVSDHQSLSSNQMRVGEASGNQDAEPPRLSAAFLQSVQPTIEIRQRMPETIRYGRPAPIELQIVNSGKVPVESVTVIDEIPAEVDLLESTPPARQEGTSLSWPLGRMEPGQTEVIRFNLKINATDPNWTLTHAARVQMESGVSGSTRVLRPMIELDVTGPDQGVVGEAVTYTINVSNVGNVAATRVVLQDNLPNGLTHPYGPSLENDLGELRIGESRKIQLTLTPSQVGDIANNLVVIADDMPKVEQAVVLKVQPVRLELTTEAPKVRYVNRACEYSFTVTNTGKMEARQAELVTRLPDGIAFTQASDGGKHSEIERCVAWDVSNLKPGESRTYVVKAIATHVGEQVCETVLTSQGDYRSETKVATRVRGVPALLVEVQDLEDPIELGEETIYEIKVVNQGTLAATNVRISIDVPAEIKPVAAEGPTHNRMANSVLSFEPIPRIEPQDDVLYRVKVRGAVAGDSRFRVLVQSDQLSKPIVEEEATTVYRTEE